MIIIKSKQEIEIMRQSGKVTAYILKELEDFIKPGISTMDIDRHVSKIIRENNMVPTFLGYQGYPASICASVNEEVVHGIPSNKKILKEGDIISIDVGSTYNGYVSDAARTYPVGKISEDAQKIIDAAKAGFFAGLEFCKEGYRLSDISNAIQQKVEGEGFGVIRDLVGHGVGRNMHEEPQIPNYG
ncbi:MAG: type I methionyl aminopeptidase, partial [Anaerovoracaceae bacterium]